MTTSTQGCLILCNEDPINQIELSNEKEFSLDGDGWAMVAPFGDRKYPHSVGPKGYIIQRLTKESAQEVVNAFQSFVGQAKRFFRGAPMFVGHPDDPATGHQYPHKEPVGVFRDMKVGDDGLYVRPVFTDKGADFLNKEVKLFPSVRWPVKATGEKDGVPVYEPFNLTSIGMVRNPNLPTEMLNAKQENNIMDKKLLIPLLGQLGLTLANDATDDVISNSVLTLANEVKTKAARITALEAEVTAVKTRADAAELTLANDRKEKASALIIERIKSGAITEAEKPLWEKRLEHDLVNESVALLALPGKIKTLENKDVSGARDRAVKSVNEAEGKILALVNTRQAELIATGKTAPDVAYRIAYNQIQSENPALFDALSAK